MEVTWTILDYTETFSLYTLGISVLIGIIFGIALCYTLYSTYIK